MRGRIEKFIFRRLFRKELEVVMKPWPLKFLLILFLCLLARASFGAGPVNVHSFLLNLIKRIPLRLDSAITGTAFARAISALEGPEREKAILAQLSEGVFPDYLRKLKPVYLSHRFEDGHTVTATIFVMPDYLSIGSDQDFLLIPVNLHTALEIAGQLGFILPTKKMVDQIVQQSNFRFSPQPLPAGSRMRSTAYYLKHSQLIREQRSASGCPLEALVSGHKKDVVLTNRLGKAVGKIAIYGWHRLSGLPIQPLSTVHGAAYADYSHGIRLVSETVLIDGKPWPIYDVLEDPKLAAVLSDEGPMPGIRRFLALHRPQKSPLFSNKSERG